jgi:hypothetical protein
VRRAASSSPAASWRDGLAAPRARAHTLQPIHTLASRPPRLRRCVRYIATRGLSLSGLLGSLPCSMGQLFARTISPTYLTHIAAIIRPHIAATLCLTVQIHSFSDCLSVSPTLPSAPLWLHLVLSPGAKTRIVAPGPTAASIIKKPPWHRKIQEAGRGRRPGGPRRRPRPSSARPKWAIASRSSTEATTYTTGRQSLP